MHFSFREAKLQPCNKTKMMMNISMGEDWLNDCIYTYCMFAKKLASISTCTQSLIWRWHTKVIHISSNLFTVAGCLFTNGIRLAPMFAFTIWMKLKTKRKKNYGRTPTYVSVSQIARIVGSILMHICKLGYTKWWKTTTSIVVWSFRVVDVVMVHLKPLLLLLLPSRNLCYLVVHWDCFFASFVVNFERCMSMRKEITKIQLQSIIWFFIPWMCFSTCVLATRFPLMAELVLKLLLFYVHLLFIRFLLSVSL